MDWQLLREQVLELVCKSSGLLLTIYGSFALCWWIVHYTGTPKFIVLLFSLSCCLAGLAVDFCIKLISLGSSSNWSFLQRTAAFVPLSGEALGVCSTVCASSVSDSYVQPVKPMSAGGAGVLGEAWSPLSVIS